MKKIVLGLILGLVISGCSSSWHIQKAKKICPECFDMDTTIKEIVFKLDTVIHLDTNILVLLPRDTVKIEKLIPINRNFKKIIKKQGIITTEVEAIKGMLRINSYLDSSFIYNLQTEIRVKDAIIKELREVKIKQTVTIEKQKTELKWYQKAYSWLRYALMFIAALLFVAIIIKVIKWIKK